MASHAPAPITIEAGAHSHVPDSTRPASAVQLPAASALRSSMCRLGLALHQPHLQTPHSPQCASCHSSLHTLPCLRPAHCTSSTAGTGLPHVHPPVRLTALALRVAPLLSEVAAGDKRGEPTASKK
ncbi:hypothetical protein ZWY2020_000004 [Hordeum vulgare]|nr:hypothetical protein ZWY2020_000004 [Hordeum vulgare]